MTRYDQLQRKMKLLHKAILNTSGDMQNIWKKHLKEIVKLVNSLSIKELSEEVK
jgi:hypothetical protein